MEEEPTHSGGHEQETPFSIDEYQKLLKLLNIKLPKEVLTPDVITQSTCSKIIEDAKSIKQDLENCTHTFAPFPRLACGQVKLALELQEKKNFQDITKIIFLREVTLPMTRTRKPIKIQWKTMTGCGFRIRDTYREAFPHLVLHAGGFNGNKPDPKDSTDCFKFYLQQRNLTENDVTWKQNGKLEFEFLTGKPNFLVNIKKSTEDESPAEKIVIKCNSAGHKNVEKILQLPRKGHQKAQFKTCHHHYLHTQASLFILKETNKEQNLPVSAVMVLKVAEDFYWGEVNEDTEKIEQLNNFCKNEVMPRFLALLNLIFEREM